MAHIRKIWHAAMLYLPRFQMGIHNGSKSQTKAPFPVLSVTLNLTVQWLGSMSVTQGHSLVKAFDGWHCRNAVELPSVRVRGNFMQQQQVNHVQFGLCTGAMKLRAPAVCELSRCIHYLEQSVKLAAYPSQFCIIGFKHMLHLLLRL